jgi:hypothetical protein
VLSSSRCCRRHSITCPPPATESQNSDIARVTAGCQAAADRKVELMSVSQSASRLWCESSGRTGEAYWG